MDQEKIGRFIAACRRENGYTQSGLAEMLGITDRAVSKWETGKSLPDSSIMLPLCDILKINVNELLTGEHIVMEDYQKMAEENMMSLRQSEERSNRYLLTMEVFLIIVSMVLLVGAALLVSYVEMPDAWRLIVMTIAFVMALPSIVACMVIEQKAGYYQCPECGHKHVPSLRAAMFAVHMGWTKKLVCPKCGKKCWQKKVLYR